jgi:hypothetical protein
MTLHVDKTPATDLDILDSPCPAEEGNGGGDGGARRVLDSQLARNDLLQAVDQRAEGTLG